MPTTGPGPYPIPLPTPPFLHTHSAVGWIMWAMSGYYWKLITTTNTHHEQKSGLSKSLQVDSPRVRSSFKELESSYTILKRPWKEWAWAWGHVRSELGLEAMKGVSLGFEVYSKIISVLRSQDREYWLGPKGKPRKIPLDMGLDILQILLMSCSTPCMVLSLGPW